MREDILFLSFAAKTTKRKNNPAKRAQRAAKSCAKQEYSSRAALLARELNAGHAAARRWHQHRCSAVEY